MIVAAKFKHSNHFHKTHCSRVNLNIWCFW